jgi:hypothetical protein
LGSLGFALDLEHGLPNLDLVGAVGHALTASLMQRNGGHNGIFIGVEDMRDPANFIGDSGFDLLAIDPDWGDA